MRKHEVCPTLDEEKYFWQKGYQFVIGIDEVGRGAFAGPVVVSAVIFAPSIVAEFSKSSSLCHVIRDSKTLKPETREKLANYIKQHAYRAGVAEGSVQEINTQGILKATNKAFRRVIKEIFKENIENKSFILIDGNCVVPNLRMFGNQKQKAIVRGDQTCFSIASASIVAKVYRDNLMQQVHAIYPNYGFKIHKGYGTKKHRDSIGMYGLSRIHRTSFSLEKYVNFLT